MIVEEHLFFSCIKEVDRGRKEEEKDYCTNCLLFQGLLITWMDAQACSVIFHSRLLHSAHQTKCTTQVNRYNMHTEKLGLSAIWGVMVRGASIWGQKHHLRIPYRFFHQNLGHILHSAQRNRLYTRTPARARGKGIVNVIFRKDLLDKSITVRAQGFIISA